MGDIGPERRRIEVLPERPPAPAEPEPAPERPPATPPRQPARDR